MRHKELFLLAAVLVFCSAVAYSQSVIVVHDPSKTNLERRPTKAEDDVFTRDVMPAVRRMIKGEMCEESLQEAGLARGSFTAAGAKQTLIFYQYCQTGNGFGWNGLALIENGKLVGNFVSEGGWAVAIESVADVNKNGLNEFTLAYSGGLHQGQGGTGVDLMEFAGGMPKGIGWYKAEEFGPTEAINSWKLTAKPGTKPVYYKQKYFSGEGKRPRPVGRNSVTKLEAVFTSKFERVR